LKLIVKASTLSGVTLAPDATAGAVHACCGRVLGRGGLPRCWRYRWRWALERYEVGLLRVLEGIGKAAAYPCGKRLRCWVVAGLFVVFVLWAPASAVAGRTVRSGNDTASISVSAKPQPGAARSSHGAKLRFVVKRGTINGQPRAEVAAVTTLRGPRGLRYNTSAFPRCIESKWLRSSAYNCPALAAVGAGRAMLDGRPKVPNLVPARVTAFNSSNDIDKPRAPKPGLMLDTHLGGGQSAGGFYDVTPAGALILDEPPALPGFVEYLFATLDVTVGGLGTHRTPYIQLPATCPRNGLWRFSFTERFPSGRKLVATHDLRCRRAQ
jgi:hypothetical protein